MNAEPLTCDNCDRECAMLTEGTGECCLCADASHLCSWCEGNRDREDEHAYERFCESFYGGEVETLDQQHRRLHEEKRKLS